MTTVIWDGEYLASDGRMTEDHIAQSGSFKKIFTRKKPRTHLAAAGLIGWIDGRFEWIMKNCPFEQQSPAKYKDKEIYIPENSIGEFQLLLVRDNKGFVAYGDLEFVQIYAPYAMGSGGSFALGNYDESKDVKKAIECAMKYDIYSGGEVQVVKTLED